MDGAQTVWGLPGEKAEPGMLLLPLPFVFQKQLDLLVPKQSECLKDNDEIFLNAYLDTIVNAAQRKLPAMLEIKEPIPARSVHCVGVGFNKCL